MVYLPEKGREIEETKKWCEKGMEGKKWKIFNLHCTSNIRFILIVQYNIWGQSLATNFFF